MRELVSVVMSVYNEDVSYLVQSINSIIKQSYTNVEVIIVNDGSDETVSRELDRFKEKDKRINIIKRYKRMGLAYSLNEGISASTGKYIARMDSDDISDLQRLEEQVSFLEDNPGVDVVGTQGMKINKDGKVVGKLSLPEHDFELKTMLLFNSCFIHPSIMGRRSFFERNNYNDWFMRAQDYDLWVRGAISGFNFANLNKYLIYYRVGDVKEQARKAREQIRFSNEARKKFIYGKYKSTLDYNVDGFLYLTVPPTIEKEKPTLKEILNVLRLMNDDTTIKQSLFRLIYYRRVIALVLKYRMPIMGMKYLIAGVIRR